MDLTIGFQIEEPHVLVPWEIYATHLKTLLHQRTLKQVTRRYLTTSVRALGLETAIGFHFVGSLDQIELFNPDQHDLPEDFLAYEEALERNFGPPTRTKEVDGFPAAREWRINGCRILHFAQEQFGPESHLRILRPSSVFGYDPFGS